MKKFFFPFIALLALVVGLTACSRENEIIPETPPTNGNTPKQTFNFSFENGNATRAVKSEWKTGDVVNVYFSGTYDGFLKYTYDGSTWTAEEKGTLGTITSDTKALAMWTDKSDHNPSAAANIGYPSAETLSGTTNVTVSGTEVTGSFTMKQLNDFTKVTISGLDEGTWRLKIDSETSACQPLVNVIDATVKASPSATGIQYYTGNACDEEYYFFVKTSGQATTTFTLENNTSKYTKTFNKSLSNEGGKAVIFKGPQTGDLNGWTLTFSDNDDGTGTLNGHAWVDLGIKSDGKRLVFATTNIGAESPEDAGLYFWWGDIVGHAVGADGKTTPEFDFNSTSASSYGNNTDYVGTDNILKPEKDAATQLWGGGWRMGTSTDFNALLSYRSSTESTINSVTGYEYKSSTNDDLKIFIPKVGDVEGTVRKNTHLYLYWTSTNENEYKAKRFGGTEINGECWRWNGYPIRPVAVIP